MNSRTAAVNALNAVNLASRLATLIVVILIDAWHNDDLESGDVDALWHAAECDGFTVDTFCAAYTMLVDGGEIKHFAVSVSYWVPSDSPIYDDAKEESMIIAACELWQDDTHNPCWSMLTPTNESDAFDSMFASDK